MRFRYIIYILAAFFTLSCSVRGGGEYSGLELVDAVLADTSGRCHHMLSAEPLASGSLCIMGQPEDVALVAEEMLSCDHFDNIDGKLRNDYLPDFAGEKIAPIFDIAGAPYSGYRAMNNLEYLRELNVRNFLHAIDNQCLYSPYDREQKISRLPAKAVVLASSHSCAYGYYDIDTLRRATKCRIPVFGVLQTMIEDAEACKSGNIVIWGDPQVKGDGVYERVLSRSCRSRARFRVLVPRGEGPVAGRLVHLLDLYRAGGDSTQISALIIDDRKIDPDSLRAAIDYIASSEDGRLWAHKGLVADGISCITPSLSIASHCCKYLRDANAFTHHVSRPSAESYLTMPTTDLSPDAYLPDGSLSDTYKFNRAAGSDHPTYCLVELRPRYISDSLARSIRIQAPELAKYVCP